MSSSCTGVYTVEVSMALVQKICNSSGVFDFRVDVEPYSCHDFCFKEQALITL